MELYINKDKQNHRLFRKNNKHTFFDVNMSYGSKKQHDERSIVQHGNRIDCARF